MPAPPLAVARQIGRPGSFPGLPVRSPARTGITWQNSCEGGTNATSVTIGNSGGVSGNAFTSITAAGSGTTPAYSSTQAAHGSLSIACVTGATAGTSFLQWGTSANPFTGSADGRALFYRFSYQALALPAVSCTIFKIAGGAGARFCQLLLTSTGTLSIQNTSATTIGSFTTTLSAGQWYRFEINAAGGISTASDFIDARLYVGQDSPVIAEEQVFAGTTFVGSPTPAGGQAVFGAIDSVASNFTSYYDDFGYSTDTWLGRVATYIYDYDTFTGADAAASTGLSSSDTLTGTDAGETIGLSGTDTFTGADAGSAPSSSLSDTDTFTGADTAVSTGLSSSDTLAGADAVSSIGLSSPDTFTGADAASTGVAGSDTGSFADASGATGLSAADTFSGADTAKIGVSSSDTFTGVDAGTLPFFPLSDTETGVFTEKVPVTVGVNDAVGFP